MFFILSKVLGFFTQPSNLIMVLGALGIVLLATRFHRAGRALAVAALSLFALVGFSPLGNLMMLILEDRFPAWDAGRGAPAGIVVLGGALSPDVSTGRGVPALNEAGERMTATVELARRYPDARIVFSGGDATLVRAARNEADIARQLFEGLGLAGPRVTYEGRSRNTAENATFTKALVRPKDGERWLLVTSAFHMPRAMGAFRAAGFPIEAHPVDFRTRSGLDAAMPFASLADGLKRTDTAMREFAGLIAYRLTGRTSALFPAP